MCNPSEEKNVLLMAENFIYLSPREPISQCLKKNQLINNIKPWQREEGGLSSSGHMNLNSRPTSANQPTPLGAHGWKSRCNHSFFAVGRGPPSAGACIMPVVFPAEENPCVHQDFAEPFQTVMCELTLGAPGHPLRELAPLMPKKVEP